jgi:penicillin-binding protein 1C
MRALWPFLLAGALLVSGGLRDAADQWIDRTDLPVLLRPTSVEVRARDGSLLRAFTVADGRWRMEPGPVDPLFLAMLVAYEDKRFYSHPGIDPVALARAVAQAVWNRRVISGGSTLTMQVARLLEDSGTGKMAGKLRQIRVALALERRLSKAQILDLYLRIAPYGGNLEGLRAASLAYLGKDPRRLTPAQAALLVALPQSPESRRPDRAPDRAAEARTRVLGRMTQAGVLAADQAAAALSEPVPTTRKAFPALAPHLAARLAAEHPGAGVIDTTIDAGLQLRLEHLAALSVRSKGDRLSLAIVVADHRTGEILASVGSPDWTSDRRAGFVDMTRALRSPGSTLKPFVYALSFDEGLAHPETLIEDRPIAFGPYKPQNFDKTFRGTVSVRQALQMSLNIPVVSLTDALGAERLLSTLERSGAKVELPGGQAGLAVALGGLGISLEDLVGAYAALARLGRPMRLSATTPKAEGEARILSPEAAWMVTDILAGLPPPPGAAAHRLAYKTGTSYGHRDAWALGYDGAHVAGVWMGRPDGSPVPGAFGGDLAAPVLFQVFGRIAPTFAQLPPPPPATLILPNARLPKPLQHFRPRGAVFAEAPADAPKVSFPPDGAEVELLSGALTVKVAEGHPPFTWLANGRPAAIGKGERETDLMLAPGFVTLSVIDAAGRSSSVSVRLH